MVAVKFMLSALFTALAATALPLPLPDSSSTTGGAVAVGSGPGVVDAVANGAAVASLWSRDGPVAGDDTTSDDSSSDDPGIGAQAKWEDVNEIDWKRDGPAAGATPSSEYQADWINNNVDWKRKE